MNNNNNNNNETNGSDLLKAAVTTFLTSEVKVWSDQVKACQDLARVDAECGLADGERAKVASKVRLSIPAKVGQKLTWSMSSATYSKRVKVGRFAPETAPDDVVKALGDGWAEVNATSDVKLTWRDAFELACATPSLDKFYEWLPKAEHLARAKSARPQPAAVEPVTVSKPETVPFADDDAARVAREFLTGLGTRGASKLQVSMVIDELIRLTTPVRSVPAAA